MCSHNISKLEKVAILTKLVEDYFGEFDFINSVKLAKDLASVIDELSFFRTNLTKLTDEFFDLFPEHWKERTQFLLIATKYWSKMLKDRGEEGVQDFMRTCCNTISEYITPHTLTDIVKNKNISIIESIDIYEEINFLIDIIRKYQGKRVSIISPNSDFSKYLIAKLRFEKIDYVSYVTNETMADGFIEDIKNNFQNISEKGLKKLTKELAEFSDIEKKSSNVSIFDVKDIPKTNSGIIICTELNEIYWKPQENGQFWLHNLLRKRLNLDVNQISIEKLFYDGIDKNSNVYFLRSQKSNGQNMKKSSVLAKFEAIAKKENLNFKVNQKHEIKKVSKIENSDTLIKRDLFKFPPDISIRSIELLFKDSYAFYIKEILNLETSEFDKEKKDLSIAFRNVIRCYFDDKSNLQSWLNLIKEIDFFGYQKSLNILNFLDKSDLNPNSKNNILGKINIPQFGINIYGYCDRVEEESNSSTLISYQTSSNQSVKDIVYGDNTSLFSACLIAEKQGFAEIKKPIRRIQIWNILSPEDNLVVAKDIEISKELIMEFENRLLSTLDIYLNSKHEKIDCKPLQKKLYNKYKHFKRN